jgi:medium-chain acyl-[acyl-carrier-protein] hydrolase
MSANSIIYIPAEKPNARFRLICFPYAGGSSLTYIPWVKNLHPDVELVLIQLPGRGVRFSEAPFESMDVMVKSIYLALTTLTAKPFIFFGHSMGARVAYELALQLFMDRKRLPSHFIVSGSPAPFIERKEELTHDLPDESFIHHIRELKGTPEEVLQNDELMQLLLPVLRADFKIVETYCNSSIQEIPTKVSVFAGKKDDIDLKDMESWLVLFESNTGVYWFDGDHFFIDEFSEEVLLEINQIIKHYLSTASGYF